MRLDRLKVLRSNDDALRLWGRSDSGDRCNAANPASGQILARIPEKWAARKPAERSLLPIVIEPPNLHPCPPSLSAIADRSPIPHGRLTGRKSGRS